MISFAARSALVFGGVDRFWRYTVNWYRYWDYIYGSPPLASQVCDGIQMAVMSSADQCKYWDDIYDCNERRRKTLDIPSKAFLLR